MLREAGLLLSSEISFFFVIVPEDSVDSADTLCVGFSVSVDFLSLSLSALLLRSFFSPPSISCGLIISALFLLSSPTSLGSLALSLFFFLLSLRDFESVEGGT